MKLSFSRMHRPLTSLADSRGSLADSDAGWSPLPGCMHMWSAAAMLMWHILLLIVDPHTTRLLPKLTYLTLQAARLADRSSAGSALIAYFTSLPGESAGWASLFASYKAYETCCSEFI